MNRNVKFLIIFLLLVFGILFLVWFRQTYISPVAVEDPVTMTPAAAPSPTRVPTIATSSATPTIVRVTITPTPSKAANTPTKAATSSSQTR